MVLVLLIAVGVGLAVASHLSDLDSLASIVSRLLGYGLITGVIGYLAGSLL